MKAPLSRRPQLAVLIIFLSNCATTGGTLHADAAHCDSFADFDARAREALSALEASAPGEVLMRESSRITASRKACARHTLEHLLERRETSGVESMQRELNAMNAAFSKATLHALLDETLGQGAAQLEPLLVEAQSHSPELKLNSTPPPEAPASLCDEVLPCAQLKCVSEKHEPTEHAARACLDSLTRLSVLERATRVSEVLQMLPSGTSGARTEAMTALNTLRLQVWPRVQTAKERGQMAHAAELAAPFGAIDELKNEVESLQRSARKTHLELAQQSGASPSMRWLHQKIAERFGGEAAVLPGDAGGWKPSRWLCTSQREPKLPALPFGMRAQLTARCDDKKKDNKKNPDDSMSTFELEAEMASKRITGKVVVTCGSVERLQTINSLDVELLEVELERVGVQNAAGCVRAHTETAERECASVDGNPVIAASLVTHALAMQRWPACFVNWWAGAYGVSLPPLPSPGKE